MFTHFTEAELIWLITNKIEEDLHLDYKGAGSLCITDGKKKEIAKDVSAFANSDGGTIIYGIKEFDDASNRHLPEKLDPIDRTYISKEWLEQIINSNVTPKILGIIITPIQLSTSNNDVSYIVTIPKSNIAHQASDKRYYKRYNFASIAMEDYELKDIINRLSSHNLIVILDPLQTTFTSNILQFPIALQNQSKYLAKDIIITLEFNNFQNYTCVCLSGFIDQSNLNPGKRIYTTNQQLTIYNGINAHIGIFRLNLTTNTSRINIATTVCGDNMFPMIDNIEIIIENGIPRYSI